MSLTIRHRAGLVLAGLVIAAPLLGSGPADAATTTITFSGQPLAGVLSCPSAPSRSTLTVKAGTTVDFVNRTGRTATLWAGNSQKELPDKSLVPVTFAQGPASIVVQMVPKCSLDLGKHLTMTVNVVVAGPAAKPTSRVAQGGPTATPAPHATATHSSPALAPTTGTTDEPTPASTMSDGTTPATDAATAGTGDNNPFAAAPAGDASRPIIGSAKGPTQPRSASGLLTLIATVGVVGVSAAAIRAILAQRASRALMA